MRIAIVDSGLESQYLQENTERIHFYIDDDDYINIDNDVHDENGHGTFVYKLIKSICYDMDIQYVIVKVLDEKSRSNSELLTFALEYLLNIDLDIIILCLASSNAGLNNKMQIITNRITSQNKIMIASLNNNNGPSYPAIFKNVFGVQGMPLPLSTILYDPSADIQCTADASNIFTMVFNKLSSFKGNSKATAFFAACIIRHLQHINRIDIECVHKELLNGSVGITYKGLSDDKIYEALLNYSCKYFSPGADSKHIFSYFTDQESFTKYLINVCHKFKINLATVIFSIHDFVSIYSLHKKILLEWSKQDVQ